jgi:hypothetical protein
MINIIYLSNKNVPVAGTGTHQKKSVPKVAVGGGWRGWVVVRGGVNG